MSFSAALDNAVGVLIRRFLTNPRPVLSRPARHAVALVHHLLTVATADRTTGSEVGTDLGANVSDAGLVGLGNKTEVDASGTWSKPSMEFEQAPLAVKVGERAMQPAGPALRRHLRPPVMWLTAGDLPMGDRVVKDP